VCVCVRVCVCLCLCVAIRLRTCKMARVNIVVSGTAFVSIVFLVIALALSNFHTQTGSIGAAPFELEVGMYQACSTLYNGSLGTYCSEITMDCSYSEYATQTTVASRELEACALFNFVRFLVYLGVLGNVAGMLLQCVNVCGCGELSSKAAIVAAVIAGKSMDDDLRTVVRVYVCAWLCAGYNV
jgi:hypothetical protein